MIQLPNIDEFMKQEVSRKDFLRYIGIAFLSLVGIANVLKSLQANVEGSHTDSAGAGYGMSAYGK